MRIEFKQAASFDGVKYPLGIHDVPESVLKHHYFLKLLDAGLILEPKTETVDSMKARNKALAEKIAAQEKAEAEKLAKEQAEKEAAEKAAQEEAEEYAKLEAQENAEAESSEEGDDEAEPKSPNKKRKKT